MHSSWLYFVTHIIHWFRVFEGPNTKSGPLERSRAVWMFQKQNRLQPRRAERRRRQRAAESCTGCNWLSLGCACEHSLSTNPPKGSRQSPQSTEESIWHGFLGATRENDTVHFNIQLESTSMGLFDRLKKGTVDANSPTAVIHTVMRRYIVGNYQNLLCSDPG